MSDKEITTKQKIVLNPLTPTNNAEKGELYSEVINDAIEMEGVYNIALTGGYGSGKSSIIETFISKNESNYRFLRVSLASFNFEKSDDEEKPSKTSKVFGKSNSETDEKIALEISILQQLLYQLDSKKEGYSLRGRADINPQGILFTIGLLFTGIISGQILWNPYVLKKWFPPKFVDSLGSPFWAVVFFLLFFGAAGIVLFNLIYLLKKAKVSKIDVKPLSVELEKRSEISTFNAFLDELLYAFKKIDLGKRQKVKKGVIVIFEDIDRVKGHQIFQKIRELNNILKYNPDTNSKKVKFIYAVKESIFAEERDKNKFFDLIIPVLRYVNNQNSKEKLTNKFDEISKNQSLEFDEVIQIASYCIDEMRTINNIFNEFHIYQSALVDTDKLSYKVLALVIYKNLFPKDFELIHSGESALQKLFEQREEFVKLSQAELQLEIVKLKEELASIDSDHVHSKDQLKKEYILATCYYLKSRESFLFTEYIESVESLHEDENFQKILNGELRIRDQFGTIRQLSLHQIESKINHQNSFQKRLELLDERNGGAIEDLRRSIQQKEKHLSAIRRLPFGELNPIVKADKFQLNPENLNYDKFKLDFVRVCISKGYIGSDYKHYISVFHSNQNFSVQDRLFLMAVKANNEDQWETIVEVPSNVLNVLSMSDWSSEALVNRSILEYLFNNEKINSEGRKQLIKSIVVREDNLEIINELFNEVVGKTSLLSEVMSEWQSFLDSAQTSTQGVLHFMYEVLLNVNPEIVKNQYSYDNFADYLSHQKTLLDNFPTVLSKKQLKNFKENLRFFCAQFDSVEVSEKTNLKLLDAIFEIDCYQLNLHMITLYLKNQDIEEYQFSYKGLKAVIPNSPVLSRMEVGKDDFILIAMKEATELEMEWFEDQQTFLEIINDTMLSTDALEFLLANVTTDSIDVNQVTRNDVLVQLIHAKLIIPSWKNIMALHNPLMDENEELELLLNDSDWVSKVKEPTNWEEISEDIIYNLLGSKVDINNLSSLLVNSPEYIILEKLLNRTRSEVVSMLVQNDHISFNRENFNKLAEEYGSHLALDFIIKDHKEFIKTNSEYSDLEIDEILYILNTSSIQELNKTVLKLISIEEIEKSSIEELNSLVAAFNKYKELSNVEIIKAIMAKLLWKQQINWFASIVDSKELNIDKLIELIAVFEIPYNAFVKESTGKWIPYNSETKLLNAILKDLGLVNSISKVKDGKILIKRNSSH